MSPPQTRIYLDANATEPLRPAARAAALGAMDLLGNPSSIHTAGREARRMLEQCRQTLAEGLGAAPQDVIFTSGGTEANALAIAGLCANRRILVGATEHDAVRAAAPHAAILPVQACGQIDLAALQGALAHGPALVCLMLANNETGVLHPIAEAARLCHQQGALLHVDAVQAAGRLPLTLAACGADSLAISGHKLGGPKGAGALILRAGLHLNATLPGGGQERGRRGGTPALPAIAGMAAAYAEASPNPDIPRLRAIAEHAAVAAGAVICGNAERLPNTLCIARPGLRAQTQVIALDLAGIAVSAGAACSSGKVAASHVLAAMGLTDLADCAIRVSLPWNVREADIAAFVTAYTTLLNRAAAA